MKKLAFVTTLMSTLYLAGCDSAGVEAPTEGGFDGETNVIVDGGQPTPPVLSSSSVASSFSSIPPTSAPVISSSSVSSSIFVPPVSSASSVSSTPVEPPDNSGQGGEGSSSVPSSSPASSSSSAPASSSIASSSSQSSESSVESSSSESVSSSEASVSSASSEASVSSSSAAESSSSSDAASSSSQPAQGNSQKGKEYYESQEMACVNCHGLDGQSGIMKAIDPTLEFYKLEDKDDLFTLEDFIDLNMNYAPDYCDQACVQDIAAYIRSWAEGESSSSEVSSSEAASSEISSSVASSEASSSSVISSVASSSSSSEVSSSVPVVSSSSSSSSVVSSVASSVVSSSAASSSSEAYVGDAVNGQELYENGGFNCVNCHGSDGQLPTFKAIDPTREFYEHSSTTTVYSLEDYIDIYMPAANKCTGTCAADIAAYIRTWAEVASSSSSDASSSSESSSEASSSQSSQKQIAGLLYHFALDEGQGSVTQDSQGNADEGDLNGGNWVQGQSGMALDFANGEKVMLDDVNVDSDGITISAWFKADSAGQLGEGRIISKSVGLSEDEHNWMISFGNLDGQVRLRFRVRTTLIDTKTLWGTQGEIKMGTWQHVAATYDGDTMRLYLDGVQIGSTQDAIGPVESNPSVAVAIGDNPNGGRGFDGSIDEVRIYSRALNAEDIEAERTGMLDNISSGSSSSSDSSSGSEGGGIVDVIPDEIIPITERVFSPKFSCDNPETRGASQDEYRRLTRQELINALHTLFGDTLMSHVETEIELVPAEVHGTYAENFSSALTSSHLGAINTVAGKLAGEAVTDADFISRFTNCANLDSSACVTQLVENFGARALRRPLTTDEVNYYVGIFNSDNEVTAAALIHAFLLDVEFNLQVEKGDAQGARYRLNQYEIASRISFRTTADIPDDTLWTAAKNGELASIEQVRAQVARLYATNKGKAYIRSFFRNWVEVEDSAEVAVSEAYKDGIDVDALYADALNDFDKFVDYIVWDKNGDMDDLFHDTSVFPQTNQLAQIYGSGVWSNGNPLSASSGHKGILLRAASLIGGSNHTPIILRGVMVRRRLLCDVLPTPSQEIVNARADSADPNELNHEVYSNRIVTRNLTKDATCMSCHSMINPLGFALEDFDSLGRAQTVESVFSDDDLLVASHDVDPVAYFPEIESGATNALMGADDLALALTTSSKLQSCFATQLFRFQQLKHEEQEDDCGLNERENLLGQSNGSILDTLILNVANEDIFWRGN